MPNNTIDAKDTKKKARIINPSFKNSPQKTLDYLKKQDLKLSFDYHEIEAEAHFKSFTAAKIMKLDILKDFHTSLILAQKEGKSFDNFVKELKPNLQKKGWWGEKEVVNPKTGELKTIYVGSRRLRTIFETNSRVAYHQGRADGIYKSDSQYLRYNAILDSRTRIDHAKMHGTIKHRDDPFWKNNFPPNGWRCRCFVTAHTKPEVEKKSWKIDTNRLPNIADKDWAYDTRNLSKELLEASLSQKAIFHPSKKAKDKILNTISNNSREKEFLNFIDEVSKDIKYPKSLVIAGALNAKVVDFLVSQNITPQNTLISLDKHSFTHMKRETKNDRGTSLSIEEIKQIPKILNNPSKIVYDTTHDNLLFIQDIKDNTSNKIAIEINYKKKGELFNMIVTTGKLKTTVINGNIESGIYKEVKR